jgi:glycosyltransferase involved in cell wall biosynthesis
MSSPAPLVSIVTATFNRPHLLALAMATVRRQTVADWEHIVVGDGCTDETAAMVATTNDRRVEFVNLPHNHGEQSVPNNVGVARARGRFLAFLNHDDLWLSDHVAAAVEALEATGADLVFTLVANVAADGPPRLHGAAPRGRYAPHLVVPASTWVMRRELAETVGPWRPARELYQAPSQEWLWRAWRGAHDLRGVPRLTVLMIASGARLDSYVTARSAEHEAYFARLADEARLRETELTRIALGYAARDPDAATTLAVADHLGRAAKNAVRRLVLALGVQPAAAAMLVRHRRRGGLIDHLRSVRGLPPLGSRG